MKDKIVELNVVKAMAIFAVLVIHTTAGPKINVPWGSLSAPLYLIVNQLSMFAVPLFIMINGLVLFYRYYDEWTWGHAVSFYKKRIQYIILPYLLWTLFYSVFNQMLSSKPVVFDLHVFWQQLLSGHAGYHLYFMVIIIQFYFAFPIFLTIIKKLKLGAWQLIFVGIVVQAVFYYIHHWVKPFAHVAALMPNYFIVFCVGAAIGMRYKTFIEHSKHLWWVFASGIVVGFMYIIMIIASKSGSHYWGTSYTVLYNLYAVLIGISFIWIAYLICLKSTVFSKIVLAFGSASFGIYLIHPAILSVWRHIYYPAPQQTVFHLYNLVSLLIVVVLPWLFVYLIKRVKYNWLIFGKS